jgi:hypothetical protein
MKKHILFCLILISQGISTMAQDSKANVGFGFGLDYGGFGGRFTYVPIERIGLFAGLGYNLNSLGYNIGAQVRFPTQRKIDWYLCGMYGYNAVLIVTGTQPKKTTYYGATIGAGMEIKFGRSEKSHLNIELLVPFRESQYQKDIDALKNSGAEVTAALPIAISIGYHIRF